MAYYKKLTLLDGRPFLVTLNVEGCSPLARPEPAKV